MNSNGLTAIRGSDKAICPLIWNDTWKTKSSLISLLKTVRPESVHNRAVDEFIRTAGFGVYRMRGFSRDDLVLPKLRRIPVPAPPAPVALAKGIAETPTDGQSTAAAISPPRDRLFLLHRDGLSDFLNPGRMGYVKDRESVAGFLPHSFTRMPNDNNIAPTEHPLSRKWRITRLELVSLLRHKTPVAYVSENLPRMDDLKNARTRPLTEFETRALRQLRGDKDLMVEPDVDRIVMLGSLRAGQNCLKCHSVQRGELLGAFSYELFPETAGKK